MKLTRIIRAACACVGNYPDASMVFCQHCDFSDIHGHTQGTERVQTGYRQGTDRAHTGYRQGTDRVQRGYTVLTA